MNFAPWQDIFLRFIPESILYIYALRIFSGKKIEFKKALSVVLLLAVTIFFVRSLPIAKFVHTILFLVAYTIVSERIIKIEMRKSILFTIIAVFILAISEILNMLIVSVFFKIPLDQLNTFLSGKSVIETDLYTVPSLLILFLIISIVWFVKKRFIKKDQ